MQFQQTMHDLKRYNWTIGMSFMTWIEKWQKLKMHFEDLQIHHKDAQITNGPWHPLPFLYHFHVIASKASDHHNQTHLLFYIHWRPKGRGAPLCFYWWVPNVSKKESSSFKGKRNKENLKYIYFGIWCSQMFLSMIPSCSHQVPNGFFNVPYVPNSSTLYPTCFGQVPLLVGTHIGSPKGKATLCLFWEWAKVCSSHLHH